MYKLVILSVCIIYLLFVAFVASKERGDYVESEQWGKLGCISLVVGIFGLIVLMNEAANLISH